MIWCNCETPLLRPRILTSLLLSVFLHDCNSILTLPITRIAPPEYQRQQQYHHNKLQIYALAFWDCLLYLLTAHHYCLRDISLVYHPRRSQCIGQELLGKQFVVQPSLGLLTSLTCSNNRCHPVCGRRLISYFLHIPVLTNKH